MTEPSLSLLGTSETLRKQASRSISREQRSTLGQFLTPGPIAQAMAGMFSPLKGDIVLLDPGAGTGVLTSAFVAHLIASSQEVTSCHLLAFEIEVIFLPPLKDTLSYCCEMLNAHGIKASFEIRQQNFVLTMAENLASPLFQMPEMSFTHAIINPPYKKINSQSLERKALAAIGIETVNLYSAFVWLTLRLLQEKGEVCAITPRSFCNGSYYLPFRKALLSETALQKIILFESRSEAFSEDAVLQENIIFHAIKGVGKPEFVEIFEKKQNTEEENLCANMVPYTLVVKPDDKEYFIHLPHDLNGAIIQEQMGAFTSTLDDLGLKVSTGPVVDFRLRENLSSKQVEGMAPLIYPEAIRNGQLIWPPGKPRKPIAIAVNEATRKWLVMPGIYILVKRFTSKEEKKRVVAVVSHCTNAPYWGIENHLNYFHTADKNPNPDLAKGLAIFLNSTLFDNYFRQFSGHTQVNATDLRRVHYPNKDSLIALGKNIDERMPDQGEIDRLVQEYIPMTQETKQVLASAQKIAEALDILAQIGAPKSQQNERSALCLLALANMTPDQSWENADAPTRGITEMMDWFRDHYGKNYAPNTRETVRRQTMHQFVQMGLALENPDKPSRPINSPYWCYQFSSEALRLLRVYGSPAWEDEKKHYLAATANLLQERHRDLPTIPIKLSNGEQIVLSAGGQNELLRHILEKFCSRFTPGGILLYVGDAGAKFIVNKQHRLAELGIQFDIHGKMPDVIIFDQARDWIVAIEAVTSHGPVDLKRHNELRAILEPSGKGVVFVTAFNTRKDLAKYITNIAWETEVWIAEDPDHLIHFNGAKFLGPYR